MKGQIQGIPKSRASAQVSFNDWEAYYNVRVNHVTILAGQARTHRLFYEF